jgi:hypothetical protein
LIEVFRQARFYPAMRDGRAVKSFKLVRIGPQTDGDASVRSDSVTAWQARWPVSC